MTRQGFYKCKNCLWVGIDRAKHECGAVKRRFGFADPVCFTCGRLPIGSYHDGSPRYDCNIDTHLHEAALRIFAPLQ